MEKILNHPQVLAYKRELDQIRQFDIIEEKTGIDRLYVVTSVGIVGFLLMLGAFGGSPVANFVGFVYPTYKSYKALKSEQKDDDTQWLTYWVVYSFFIVIESFTDVLISWVPFYYLTKIVFLLCCMSPTFKGSSLIFHRFIEPLLDQTSKTLDEVEDNVRDAVDEVAEKAQKEITERGTAFAVSQMMNQNAPDRSESASPAPGEASDGE